MPLEIRTINIAIELFGILICITVTACHNYLYGSNQQKLRMLFISQVLCESLILFTSAMTGLLTGVTEHAALLCLSIFYFLRYLLIYVLLGLFTEYVICYFQFPSSRSVRIFTWGTIALGSIALIVNLITPFYYSISSSGIFMNTLTFHISQYPCLLICLENLIVVFIRKSTVSRSTFISFLFYIIVPMLALIIQVFIFSFDFVNIALILVMMFMFVVMQNRFVNEYVEQKRQLDESRTRLMISQIRPHFIFNSLTSIAQLCDDDPAQAKSTTIAFANYLRGNINALEKYEPVPFSEELAHIRNYLSIECTRFGEMLNVVYDVKTVDFYVPALSIQPLVENAVKHGVGMKEDGGTVKLSVFRSNDMTVIEIEDDGVGFDRTAAEQDDKHVGIRSSAERLKLQCGADMEIESAPGRGTKVVITIPDK